MGNAFSAGFQGYVVCIHVGVCFLASYTSVVVRNVDVKIALCLGDGVRRVNTVSTSRC